MRETCYENRTRRSFVTHKNLKIRPPKLQFKIYSLQSRAVSSYSNQTWNITVYINIKHILFHVSSRLKTAIQTNPISRIWCLWSISNVTVSQSATYTHAQQIADRGPHRISLLLTGLMLLQSMVSNPQRSNWSVWSEKWYILNTNPHTLSFPQKHNPSVTACHCFTGQPPMGSIPALCPGPD